MEKLNYASKSPEELSTKITERIKRETGAKLNVNEQKKKKLTTKESIEAGASELADLLMEKEDVLAAIRVSEEKVGVGREKKEMPTVKKDIMEMDFADMDFRALNRDFSSEQAIEESVDANRGELEKIKARVAELSADSEILKNYKENLAERIEIIRQARQVEGARKYSHNLSLAKFKMLAHRNNEDVKLTAADKKLIQQYEEEREWIKKGESELMSAPEIYFEVNRREMLNYRNQMLNRNFVETESKKEEIAEIFTHLEFGMPVLLRGHLGAGKTENALHISRKYYGVEPEFISGSEEATKYDIYGKTQIGVRSEEDKAREYKLRVDEFRKNFPDADKKELREIEKEYYDTIVVKGQAASFFQYGPLVRAMKEGKPLVIDELDAIPHSIAIRLNHVLTRRAGEKVKIQENGGEEIEIKKGFCVIATGNIKGAKYKREELDAAFLSRWWSREVKYLPLEETLKILTASLIDKRGNLELKQGDDYEALKNLVKAAEEIQKIFTGEKIDLAGEGADAAIGRGGNLEKSVLSLRDIWNIVKPWKAANFDKPLENYAYSEFIKKATVPRDAIYLIQLFCRFGFFKKWKAEDFGIAGLDKKKLEAFQGL